MSSLVKPLCRDVLSGLIASFEALADGTMVYTNENGQIIAVAYSSGMTIRNTNVFVCTGDKGSYFIRFAQGLLHLTSSSS